MNRKQLKELLAAHADKLVMGATKDPTDASIEDEAELIALLKVAERISSTLTPITLSNNFETELKRELLTTAHLRKAEGYVPPNPERDLMVVAAVVGLLAMFAGIYFMQRLRR